MPTNLVPSRIIRSINEGGNRILSFIKLSPRINKLKMLFTQRITVDNFYGSWILRNLFSTKLRKKADNAKMFDDKFEELNKIGVNIKRIR